MATQTKGRKPKTPKSAQKPSRVTIDLNDRANGNDIARNIRGVNDSNIGLIEEGLKLERFVVQGNQFVLEGNGDAVRQARQTFATIIENASRGHIEEGDLRAILNLGSKLSQMAVIRTKLKTITGRNDNQSAYIRQMFENDITFGTGPAGTGKTYLAAAFAAMALEQGEVERIILTRPAVEAGERLGFLPGDMKEKVDPYLRPLYDALYDMLPADKVERDIEAGVIEIAPLAFMRGRTLSRCVAVLDEAQNVTNIQMKMFLTRLGEGSKMIITGDPRQVDLPANQISGLQDGFNRLSGIKGVGITHFKNSDVVRHHMVARVIEAYERPSAGKPSKLVHS